VLLNYSSSSPVLILRPACAEKILLGDNTKLMQATGWKPTIEFTETLKEVLDYWRREVRVRI
jgi:GDP-4-dehydro-6-deoxy-D-mannose reductase